MVNELGRLADSIQDAAMHDATRRAENLAALTEAARLAVAAERARITAAIEEANIFEPLDPYDNGYRRGLIRAERIVANATN